MTFLLGWDNFLFIHIALCLCIVRYAHKIFEYWSVSTCKLCDQSLKIHCCPTWYKCFISELTGNLIRVGFMTVINLFMTWLCQKPIYDIELSYTHCKCVYDIINCHKYIFTIFGNLIFFHFWSVLLKFSCGLSLYMRFIYYWHKYKSILYVALFYIFQFSNNWNIWSSLIAKVTGFRAIL